MTRAVQILCSLVLAVLLWGGSAGLASAHSGHHGSAPAAALPDHGGHQTAYVTNQDCPAGDHDPMTADHCLKNECHAAPGFLLVRDIAVSPVSRGEVLLPIAGALAHGMLPTPPSRPPRRPS